MESFAHEIFGPFPDARHLVRISFRMLAALLVGAIIGLQRERHGKAAGLRTHMLVALGTALFVISMGEMGMGEDGLSRVIQGITTGIGFLGAGAILKLTEERTVQGLTTAAGVWMTAAASIAAGIGQFSVALIGTIFAWIVLSVLWRIEQRAVRASAGKIMSEQDTAR